MQPFSLVTYLCSVALTSVCPPFSCWQHFSREGAIVFVLCGLFASPSCLLKNK